VSTPTPLTCCCTSNSSAWPALTEVGFAISASPWIIVAVLVSQFELDVPDGVFLNKPLHIS
jgi:hypothetical protein